MENSFIEAQPPAVFPISVVIPAYNATRYLAQAITSIRQQTIKVAEIIVVNDGSTDDTETLAFELGARVVSQSNMGLAAARNTGIQNANYEWIALLDSDDLWVNNKLEKQWTLLKFFENLGVICCDHLDIDENGKTLQESFFGTIRPAFNKISKKQYTQELLLIEKLDNDFWQAGYFLSPSSMLFKKELALNVGLFNKDLSYVEDVEFFSRLLNKSSLGVVDLPLMKYRVHESNWSKNELGMAEGFVQMIDLMQSNPEKYSKSACQALSTDLELKLRNAALLNLKASRSKQAREFLYQSLAISFSVHTLILLLISFLPNILVKGLYKLKNTAI